ncbi:MAG: zinc ABC transporter substrate-binding protein [bacterium]
MVFRILTACVFCGLFFLPSQSPAQPRVAVSIRPLHSLAAGVMEGVGTPELVFKGGASPHGFGLRPSQARLLSRAEVVFWGGALLEPRLEKSLAARSKGLVLAMHRPAGMVLLPPRPAGPGEFPPPPLPGPGTEVQGTEAGAGGQDTFDPHYWLDPRNARVMAAAMAEALALRDPDNAGAYRKNAARMARALERLERELAARLAPLAGRPYLVFHDAYRYFERRFGLRPLGTIAPDALGQTGARRISRLRRLIRSRRVKCVFSEPQFSARILRVLTEDAAIARGVLDPMGAGLKPGKALYFRMMRDMGESFRKCLMAERP